MSIDKTSDSYSIALTKLKEITSETKYCAANTFIDITKNNNFDIREFIIAVKEDGFEVINYKDPAGLVDLVVDVRLPVVAALTAVSYCPRISPISLKKYLLLMMDIVNHTREESIDRMFSVSRDTLEQIFNDLFNKSTGGTEEGYYRLGSRSASALHALVKNDSDLTDVYRLAKSTLSTYTGQSNGSVKGLMRKDLEVNSTYNHFHRLASIILNKGNRNVG